MHGSEFMRAFRLTFLLLALSGTPVLAAEPDAERGRLLYENHCTACHESVVHVRERRKVTSFEGLHGQVLRWSRAQQLHWGDDEVRDVQVYLGRRYYGFSP